MILYRADAKTASRARVERERRTLNIDIEELPERPKFRNRTPRERRKFIDKVEKMVRSAPEYKEYIKYLKAHFDMGHCEVLQNVVNGNGKKYTIEIHHDPFQLSWITDTVIRKREDLGEELNPYLIADEILELHYRGVIGLIPLAKTSHELVHSDHIFIPLQYIYQQYEKFANEYDMWIPEYVKELIIHKVEASRQCANIQSDVLLGPIVTYIEVDGYEFPAVPDEWKDALARQRSIENPPEIPEPTEEEMQGAL